VAWNRSKRSLTLYLLRGTKVSCGTLKRDVTRPGHTIQALITARPIRALVGHAIPDQSLQFITYSTNPNARVNDAGLRQGVKLVITRIDSYPHGVWHGSLTVPTKVYGNGKVYGYHGTFAARWCEQRR
jgi:hypothetical protein